MTKLYHKKRYTGYDLVPYYDGSICIAFGHRFNDGKCQKCKMLVEFYQENTIKTGKGYQ